MKTAVLDVLDRSARLVEKWGATALADGRTLSEHLVLEGLPLWDVVSVDLSVYLMPQAQAGPPSMYRRLRAMAGRWKARRRANAARPLNSTGCAAWPTGRACLLLGFSNYLYRDVLAPVAEALTRDGRLAPVLIFDSEDRVHTALVDRGGSGQSMWQHWDRDTRDDWQRLRTRLAGQIAAIERLGLADIVTDEGRPMWREMKPVFDFIFHRQMRSELAHVAVGRHLFRRHAPAVVISPDVADSRTRIYVLLAAAHGVPSLQIAYADIFGQECVEWRFMTGTRIAAAGDSTRKVIAAQGVNPEIISVTGSVRHDRILDTPRDERARVRGEFGIADDDVMTLFASTVSLNAYDGIRDRDALLRTKAAILDSANRAAGITTIAKPHPLEDAEEIRRLASRVERVRFVDRRLDIRSLTAACDVFITLGSSATLGALITGKLVVYPAFEGVVYWDDQFLDSGAVLVVRTTAELDEVFRAVAGGALDTLRAQLAPARDAFLRAWAFQPDGHAAERIAALAADLAVRPVAS